MKISQCLNNYKGLEIKITFYINFKQIIWYFVLKNKNEIFDGRYLN